MKQKQYAPMSVAEQSLSIYAVDKGYMDDVPVGKIGAFEEALHAHFANTAGEVGVEGRSEEHTSELQSLMRISYAVFCLKKKNNLPLISAHRLSHPSARKHRPDNQYNGTYISQSAHI